MSNIFLSVLNMSIAASYVVMVVLIVRIPLKKAPRIFSYLLWLPVFFRLICPVSFRSAFSILGALKKDTVYVSPDIAYQATPMVDLGIEPVNQVVNQSLPAATPAASVNPMGVIIELGTLIWLAGAVILLTYGIVSYVSLVRRVRYATLASEGVYESEQVDSPFVLGLFRPKIFLPLGMENTDRRYVIAHEQVHIKRMDHLVKQLAFLTLVLHWFNPLVHLSFRLLTKDMEMSCDEAVMRKLGTGEKKGYSSSLLSLSMDNRKLASPLAFGESNIKSRIRNILNYNKPVVLGVVLGIALVAIVSIGCMGDPVVEADPVDEWTSWLLENRTPYLGDASAVSNIASRLHYPEDVLYRGLALQTNEPPYAITINLQAPSAYADPTSYLDHGQYVDEAFILFSLVENVDTIHFNLEADGEEYIATFDRQDARGQMDSALYSYSESMETFQAFLNELETMTFLLPREGFALSLDSIEDAFMNILLSSQASSNPNDYLSAYPEEVEYLVSQGELTLRYIYAQFDKGNQDGLFGHLYRAVAEEILDGEYDYAKDISPQFWYDLMKESMQAKATVDGLDEVRRSYPKASLMLNESNYYYAYDMVMYSDGQVEIGGQKLSYRPADMDLLLESASSRQVEQMQYRAVVFCQEANNMSIRGMRKFASSGMSDGELEEVMELLSGVEFRFPVGIEGPYMQSDSDYMIFVQLDDYYTAHITFTIEENEPKIIEVLLSVI